MAISGLVITYNEEKNIGKCIDALFKVCDEVIIVDSLSKDKTVEIAESKGAKVISQAFLGDGPQRTHGLPYCKNDWVLNLDADEFLERFVNFVMLNLIQHPISLFLDSESSSE